MVVELANYITATEFTSKTGVSGEEYGDVSPSTTNRDEMITKAQKETLREISETAVADTEDIYVLVQDAIAELTAHLFYIKRQPLVVEGIVTSPHKNEYIRLIGLIAKGKTSHDPNVAFTTESFDSITTEDLDE